MKQQDVADAVSATRRAVTTWETGKRLPRQPFLSRLAALYDVTVGYIVTGHTGEDEALDALTARVDVLTSLVTHLAIETRNLFMHGDGDRLGEIDELLEQLAAEHGKIQAAGGRRRAERSPR